MQYNPYVRKPFQVQAIEITTENIEVLAKQLGILERNEDGELYIRLDRRIVPNIKRAMVGWYVTFVNDNYRVYNPKAFADQFQPMEPTMVFTFGDVPEVVLDPATSV
jgi:hypothetical protein